MRVAVDYAPHPGQRVFHESAARHRVLACGARWGKDRCCIADSIRLNAELGRLPRSGLIPKIHGWFVAPNFPLAQQLWRELKELTPREVLAKPPIEKHHRLEWRNGAVIEVKSADDPHALVAVGLDFVVLTEAALLPKAAWTMALRPRLASTQRAGLAIFNGTPKGRNWYYRAYLRGRDPQQPDWESWHFPTAATLGTDGQLHRHPCGNPYVSVEEVEQARMDMPDRWFRQEFLAEWLSGEGSVFRNIRDRVAPPPRSPKPPLVAGVDLAKHADFSVFVIFDSDGHMVAIERMNAASYALQAERLITMLREHGVKKCVIESNGVGEPFYDMILRDLHDRRREFNGQPKTVPFAVTSQSKRQMIDALAVGFERGLITLLDDPELITEFEAYEIAETRASNVRFSAPEGGFDDRVMACALAWTEVGPKGKGRPLGIDHRIHMLGPPGCSRYRLGERPYQGDPDSRSVWDFWPPRSPKKNKRKRSSMCF
jgi:hypothetical protein